ncbi:MAG TPA: monovalent cation/H+ antiporter complex subunit F [Anaerolineae bacterium]|nr:monovalent cation/H+ antiporter complex subunit F [Anaerolineae bacterium]
MTWVLDLALGGLVLALLLGFVRILRGPTAHDRVVALDNTSSTVVGLVGVYAIRREQAVLLDVLIVIALLGFISTVAIARYLERGAQQ